MITRSTICAATVELPILFKASGIAGDAEEAVCGAFIGKCNGDQLATLETISFLTTLVVEILNKVETVGEGVTQVMTVIYEAP